MVGQAQQSLLHFGIAAALASIDPRERTHPMNEVERRGLDSCRGI